MCLDTLIIRNLRILRLLSISNGADFNLVTGDNGSGKTTVLEAIYLSGHGRSFRTHQARQFICRNADEASIRAQVNGHDIQLRRNSRKLIIHLNGKAVSRRQLVGTIPVRKFIPQDHLFIEGGSVLRRQFLDWGAFHIDPEYRQLWARFVRVLRQRNAELKKTRGHSEYWDELFCRIAEQLHQHRQQYWSNVCDTVQDYVSHALDIPNCHCRYQRGWPEELELGQALNQSLARDKAKGHTSLGPHRADLVLSVADKPANQQLSRGQQKMWNLAMNLAQTENLYNRTGRKCLWLIDDLASELDKANFQRITAMFHMKHAQFWFTAFAEQKDLFRKTFASRGQLMSTHLSK